MIVLFYLLLSTATFFIFYYNMEYLVPQILSMIVFILKPNYLGHMTTI